MLDPSTKEQFRRLVNSVAVLAIQLGGVVATAFLIAVALAVVALIGMGFDFVLSWIVGMYNAPDWLSDKLEALSVTVLVIYFAAGILAGLRGIFKLLKVTFGGDEDGT